MKKKIEKKCERCGDLFEQGFLNDDTPEMDVCEICADAIEAEEKYLANQKE